MRLIALTAVVAALVLPARLPAQSLGEVAAKERERREKAGKAKPAKVYTESDLRGRASSSGTVSQPGAVTSSETPAEGQAAVAAPSPAAGEKKEKTEDEKRAEQEQAWREKLQKARQDVIQLTEKVNRLQASLNDLSGNLYGSTRTNLLTQFESAKKELSAAQQRVTDFEEEGRRSGFR